MKKIILLTGASGFIGKNLVNYIENNFNDRYDLVLLTSQNNSRHKVINHKNYKFTKDDFLKENISRIDIIIHAGAFTPKSGAEANDIENSISNITNTFHLLNNIPCYPEKFIFLSTIDVYGQVDGVITEDKPPNPISLYGFSKLFCEKVLENAAKTYNFTLQNLRIGHIYGRGEEAYKKLIPLTIKRIKEGKSPEIIGSGNERRSFLHVKDACSFIFKSIELENYVGPINICSSKSYSVKDIINMLIKISGKDLNINYISENFEGRDYVFDTTKMNKLLGYEKINIEEGLYDEYWQGN